MSRVDALSTMPAALADRAGALPREPRADWAGADGPTALHSAGAGRSAAASGAADRRIGEVRSASPRGDERRADTADFLFEAAGLGDESVRCVGFRGAEAISELYEFEVELVGAGEALELESLLLKPCTLTIRHQGGERVVHGIVRRFERTGAGVRLTHYRAAVVPLHWLLTQRRRSRIFQAHNCPDMTTPGIVRRVLDESGIPAECYRFALAHDYAPREYVVQYRESDHNFISRLMEEEGIYYFFEHGADGHRMVIADGPVAHTVAADAGEYPFRERDNLLPEREFVYSLRDRRSVQRGAVRLDDFDFKRPAAELRRERRAAAFESLDLADYPGGYADKAVGDRLAQVRLEERQCRRRMIMLRATARGLRPGFCFELVEHPDATLNASWLVTRVEHRGAQRQSAETEADAADRVEYAARALAIPEGVVFRPQRRARRARVRGSQTAIVVGPQQEEIYTDAFGRVKVQFHWDPDGGYNEQSSCWIRVSQGMAGGNYGTMFLPRVGQEVIVDFLEGNPDHPIITGRVYNGDHLPPYSLPEHKTRSCIKTRSSTGGNGSNEIRFEDAQAREQLLFHAQRDLHVRARNDSVETVERDRHVVIGNNRVERVDGNQHIKLGGDRCEEVGGESSLAVKGMVSIQVDGTHSTTVGGDVVEKLNANHRHDVAGTYATRGANIRLEATQTIELKCGGSSLVLTPTAIYIVGGPMVKINSGPGPSVGPISARATAPAAPESPLEAERVASGIDTRYDQERADAEPQASQPTSGDDRNDTHQPAISWIEIELVDECRQPMPGERYELRLPDGQIRRNRLDANGLARVEGVEPGTCQICFPDLDAGAWERI